MKLQCDSCGHVADTTDLKEDQPDAPNDEYTCPECGGEMSSELEPPTEPERHP